MDPTNSVVLSLDAHGELQVAVSYPNPAVPEQQHVSNFVRLPPDLAARAKAITEEITAFVKGGK